jgi:ribokinase
MHASAITVVGSSNTDMFLKLPAIPRPGETAVGGEYFSAAGGKGANQAVAAARLGGRVAFVARVGADSLGDASLANFQQEGIDISQVSRDDRAPSGVALIFVDQRGENSIGVASGANACLRPAHVQAAAPSIHASGVLLLQLETPLETVLAAARLGHAAGAQIILNPAPAQALPDELLRLTSVLTPNEHEAALLSAIDVHDVPTAKIAAQALLRRGPRAVVITLGAAGAVVATAKGAHWVNGFKVDAVDTTAAGDTFNGALAVALAEGADLLTAVRFGNAAAAISVTRLGAQPSAPRREETEDLLRRSA